MKKCARCKERQVEIILKLSLNGKIREIGLCVECANIIGYYKGNVKKSDITEYIRNIIEDFYPKKKQKIFCLFCQTTYLDYLKTKKFGCPFCYIYFENFISELNIEIKNEYQSQIDIESLVKNEDHGNMDTLYLKLKTYLDYSDIQIAKEVISKIKKNDHSKEN